MECGAWRMVRAIAGPAGEVGRENGADAVRLQPVKKIRWKSQWSKGDGPGEYGGPPTDVRLRKMWGENAPDPLTSSGDYIWNKPWQAHVEALPSLDSALPAPQTKEPESGFLSLNRAISLNCIDVDLSEELSRPSTVTIQRQLDNAIRDEAARAAKTKVKDKPKWRLAPTRREEEKWVRAKKSAIGGSEFMVREIRTVQRDPEEKAAFDRARYAQLKKNLQFFTLTIGALGGVTAYFSYSPEVAGSYGAGLVGSLMYIRMLGSSIESLGSVDAGGAMRGAVGQPRLLVPVALVLVYNRWNELAVPEYGVMHLQLIPMLVGFFTYKIATLIETFRELLPLQQDDGM